MEVGKEYLLDNLKRREEFESLCGIYFLLKNKEVVYVGQTTNFHQRIGAHKDKDYDSYCFIKVEKEDLDKKEVGNIMFYQPKYNKALNDEMISIDSIKLRLKKLGVKAPLHHKKNIMKAIIKNDIQICSFESTALSYIKSCDFNKVYKEVIQCQK